MKVALFSDVHGHLRMLLHMIRNWQIAHLAHLDVALVAGDLGCFPDIEKLDKATRKWIDRDPEEAGFSKYFTSQLDTIEQLFTTDSGKFSDVRCSILFIAGNHEDYNYLKVASQQPPAPSAPQNTFPVDCYKRLHCIQNGNIATVVSDNTQLRIAGLWGIENALNSSPYKLNVNAVNKLCSYGQRGFDLLLTHDAPAEAYPYGGSNKITKVIEACRPKIQLFGHVHPINGRHEYTVPATTTRSFVFKDVSFGKEGNEGLLGSMGILEWNGYDAKLEVVEDDWLKQMRPQNWEQIWPECISQDI